MEEVCQREQMGVIKMDARELTKKVTDQENRIFKLEKEVCYLQDELQKLRLLFNDLDIDVHMLQGRR